MENIQDPNYSMHVFNRNNGDERRIHKQLHFITFNVRAMFRLGVLFYFISHYLYRMLVYSRILITQIEGVFFPQNVRVCRGLYFDIMRLLFTCKNSMALTYANNTVLQ